MKKPRKPTKPSTGNASVPGDERPAIFGGDVSNVVPGEVLLQLEEGSAAAIAESIARGPTRGVSGAQAISFGLRELDQVLAKLKVTAITRLHLPVPATSAAMAEAVSLAATFRINFDKTQPVDAAVTQLSKVPGVLYSEPNRYRESSAIPNDPSFAAQWGLNRIHCPAAWDRTTGAANVVVAVIDTGIDLDHPELAPLLVAGTDMVDLGANPTPPAGFRFEGDFQGRDNIPQDEVGHGTHVAGTIACRSNNSFGVAGVTWSCRLMPVRVLARIVAVNNPNDVRGVGSAADISAGIRWATDNGARILNLSLGGPVDTQVERDAIAYAIAHGVVVVAAMGNAFQQGNPTSFPAAYPGVIAVGAIDQADRRANFSQTGAHIDIAAPGVGVLSTVWDNGFATMSGTSMAAPHVAGVAALVMSCNSNLTGAQVGDILRQTAQPLRDNPADPVPNNNYGFGCVDALAALNRACPIVSTTAITCATQSISCRPSIALRCPTQPPQCLVSLPISCRPSVAVLCPTLSTTCAFTVPIVCPPATSPVTCLQPSAIVRCPSGPICGGLGPITGPQPFAGQGQGPGAGNDPSGMEGEPGSQHDPYASYYGEEPRCGGS